MILHLNPMQIFHLIQANFFKAVLGEGITQRNHSSSGAFSFGAAAFGRGAKAERSASKGEFFGRVSTQRNHSWYEPLWFLLTKEGEVLGRESTMRHHPWQDDIDDAGAEEV